MAEAWSAVPEWIRKAEADWIAASTLHSHNNEELHDAVVFHAQQCIEKLLKARLIQLGQPIPVSILTGSGTRRISATSQVVQ